MNLAGWKMKYLSRFNVNINYRYKRRVGSKWVQIPSDSRRYSIEVDFCKSDELSALLTLV